MAIGSRRSETHPLPPRRLRFMGESDEFFQEIGDELVDSLEREAGLAEGTRILDIGCGYGRLAHALLRRGFQGRYLGVDILKPQIRWCSRRLGSESFEFRYLDIGNDRYNPRGSLEVADLSLGERRFDVIAAFSVFTHMWPEDVVSYMRLASAHLSESGRFHATFFLLDHHWRALRADGAVPPLFPFEHGPHCRVQDERQPLHRVGYEAKWVLDSAEAAGLVPASPRTIGTWSRAPNCDDLGFQDGLTFRRAG